MPTRSFSVAELDEIGVPWGNNVVFNEELSIHRWYTKRFIVFRFDDKFYGVNYMAPSTELQEGQDVYDSDPVFVVEVEPYEVTKMAYRPVVARRVQ